MKNALPNNIVKSKQVLILCEGLEEELYLKQLKKIKVFSNKYSVSIKNVEGITKIFSDFEKAYSKDSEYVMIFCDTELQKNNAEISKTQGNQDFLKLREDLIKWLGLQKKPENLNFVLFFGGPNTMQIILSHFSDKIKLKSTSKTKNKNEIEKHTGIKNYAADEKQIADIMQKITPANYQTMKLNISKLSTNHNICPCSNFLYMLKLLESKDTSWIGSANDKDAFNKFLKEN